MLDTIVGLLDETRLQRDALMQAATRLFSEIRLANGGEFDVSAAVMTDPIGMLGNAFQFAINRFHRFMLRTKRTVGPLEKVSQQEIELTNAFLANLRQALHGSPPPIPSASLPTGNGQHAPGQVKRALRHEQGEGGNATLLAGHVERVRGQVRLVTRQDVEQQGSVLQQLVEQASRLCQQMAVIARVQNARGIPSAGGDVQALEMLLRQLGVEVQTRQQHTMQHLADVEVTLDQLAAGVHAGGIPRASVQAAEMQVQEIARLAEGFAQEVVTLAQRLRVLTQEMRSSLTPFREEVLERAGEPRSHGDRSTTDATWATT